MAKKHSSRSRSLKIPGAIVVGALAAFSISDPAGISIIGSARAGNWPDVQERLSAGVTGFGFGQWSWEAMSRFWGPIVFGALIHKYVGGPPLNLNRYLTGSPLVI